VATEHHISVSKTARYFVQGEIENGKHLLIALHGYGHLSEYFIRKFKSLDKSEFVVVCPEGPHRFYIDGNRGRVGASWMTKEDRETDILDYTNYLDTLLDELKSQAEFSSVTLLGFSQGGATASRWLAFGSHQFDRFILWATVFPPDMERKYGEKFNNSRNFFVFGTNDEYYTQESIQDHFNELNDMNIQFEMCIFDGNHNIHTETLLSILNE
jgi:predicted esterase